MTKGLLLLTVIIIDLLAGMEFDLFTPSFPELQAQFSLSPFWVEALLSVNFVGYCVSLFFVGTLSDHYGRKPMILLGLIAFIIGTLLCLSSASYHLLLMGRFLQGIGIAAPAILSFLIIADAYSLKQQQYYMAILNGIMNASVGAAPVIGCYITMYFHWQGNFVALLVLGLLAVTMTAFFVPTNNQAISEIQPSNQGYISLLQSKPLMLLITHFILVCVPYWIFVGMAPLLYMKDLGVSLSHFGYYQGILALSFAIGSIGFGIIVTKQDSKKMLYLARHIFLLSLIGIAGITFIDTSNPLLITGVFLIFIIGQIIPSVILYPLCLNLIPQAKGRVSAVIQGGRLILTTLSLQLSGHFYEGSFQNIGIILTIFILLGISTLFFVLKNKVLMDCLQEST